MFPDNHCILIGDEITLSTKVSVQYFFLFYRYWGPDQCVSVGAVEQALLVCVPGLH